ncbi:MAG TPA: hypothetical protein VFR46_03470, partial [Actinomycetes bacterium]|nr:hypothetical protein [Actinomycetes bacterium]
GVVTGGSIGPAGAEIDDSLRAAPVELVGKLVDIDPTGVCSQIFFDELMLGIPGRPHLRARPRRRMSSRWLNFGRNLGALPVAGGASAAWQAVFPRADVEIVRDTESPLLARLSERLGEPRARGLMLRLCTYRTLYFQNGVLNQLEPAADLDELAHLHAQGKPVSNPAYSLVVGTLGVWFEGEAESVPGGRQLFAQNPAPVRNAMGRSASAGPSAAELHEDAQLLSIDLSNTVPELGENVEKADFGPLAVVVIKDGNTTEIGRIEASDYARVAYETQSGIVDVDVSRRTDAASLLVDGRLAVRVDAPTGPTVLLAERELTAVCDECNVYLDEGEKRTLRLEIRERGQLPRRQLSVLIATYVQQEQITFSGEMTVRPVAADGTATFEITGEEAGYRHFAFTAFAGDAAPTPRPTLAIATAQFTSVRTLPFDDALAADTPDEALSFGFVYANILSTYDAIAPRMSNIIDVADSGAVRTFARRILETTDPDLFESSRYMPVTRDLSRGKRTLLRRFCDLVLGPPPATLGSSADRLAAGFAAPGRAAPQTFRATPTGQPFEKRAFR